MQHNKKDTTNTHLTTKVLSAISAVKHLSFHINPNRKEQKMAKIVAKSADLRNASSKISDISANFQSAYKAIISESGALGSDWGGEDYNAFNSKVQALEDPFSRMKQLLDGCSQDLQKSAQKYEDTQSQITSKASSLSTSI